jgi:hypothetical protein
MRGRRAVYVGVATVGIFVDLIEICGYSLIKHCIYPTMQVLVAARSKAWVCGRSPAEIVGSNPAGGTDVCLLRVLCVVMSSTDCGASLCLI